MLADGVTLESVEVLRPALVAELRLLMRGPGVRVGQDLSRIGPILRVMCGIAPGDSIEDAIAALAAWLRARIGRLISEELRKCTAAVLGLNEDSQLPNPSARMIAIGRQLGYGRTSVRRRVEAGIASLAGNITPADSVLHQLGEHVSMLVELGYIPATGGEVRVARCFLIAALRPMDQPNKVYALVRDDDRPGTVSAIPAVRVRHVTAVSSSSPERMSGITSR